MPSRPPWCSGTGTGLDLTLYADNAAGSAAVSGASRLAVDLAIPRDVLDSLRGGSRRPGASPARPGSSRWPSSPAPSSSPVLGRTSAPPTAGSAAPVAPFEVTFVAGGRPTSRGRTRRTSHHPRRAGRRSDRGLPRRGRRAGPGHLRHVVCRAAARLRHHPRGRLDEDLPLLQSRMTANAWFVAADVQANVKSAWRSPVSP